MKSLSEIETVSKRATRGAGFSWGVAEEVGKNIKMLEMFGLPGIKNLNSYFKSKKKKNFENLNLINKENKTSKLEFCPITMGVSFLDQVRSLEGFNQVTINTVSYPLLFLPFVSRASEIIGKKLYLQIDDKKFLLNHNNSVYSNYLESSIVEIADIVLIKFLENADSFENKDWQELYRLCEDTFVEENESLKQSAAGAGLTDND